MIVALVNVLPIKTTDTLVNTLKAIDIYHKWQFVNNNHDYKNCLFRKKRV